MKCLSRCKNNPYKQCTHIASNNSIYCKKHINSITNINIPLFSYQSIYLFLEYYINNQHINIKKHFDIIKYIVIYFNITTSSTQPKKIYYNLFLNFINHNLHYIINIKNIIKIQSLFRLKYTKYINSLKGNILFNRKLSANDTDFYTFEPINNISYNYFFSFIDNNCFYSFDIRSFNLLISKHKPINPYNRNIIHSNIINKANILTKYLINNKLYTYYIEDKLTKKQEIKQYIIKIFQIIDSFGYNTDISWFTNLNFLKLEKLWYYLEDIWSFRANLSIEQKLSICNNINNQPFKKLYQYKKNKNTLINNYNNDFYIDLQYKILDDFYILLTTGINKDSSNIGCLYILTSLSMVSPSCLENMPWLYQIV